MFGSLAKKAWPGPSFRCTFNSPDTIMETGRKPGERSFERNNRRPANCKTRNRNSAKNKRDRQCRRSEQNSWYASTGNVAGEHKHLRVLKFTAPYQEDRLSGWKYCFARSKYLKPQLTTWRTLMGETGETAKESGNTVHMRWLFNTRYFLREKTGWRSSDRRGWPQRQNCRTSQEAGKDAPVTNKQAISARKNPESESEVVDVSRTTKVIRITPDEQRVKPFFSPSQSAFGPLQQLRLL